MIKNSLDWSELEIEILRKSSHLSNFKDIKKMIVNIRFTVSELSRAEVEARTGKKHKAAELLYKVNQEIEIINEYLIIATLIN